MALSGPNPEKIRAMFGEIAPSYDRANAVLSAGIHRLWRRALVRWSGAAPSSRVLDCATGTGDLAIEFKKAVGASGEVVGTDFCPEMLAPAPAKAARAGLEIRWELADAMNLSFADDEFDVASIAFGIRNVRDPVRALSELARVTRHDGRVMVLEFGQPTLPILAQAYRLYSAFVLPAIGGWVTGKPDAYDYLQASAKRFPCGEAFAEVMRSTGAFSAVESRPLSLGIAYLYRGTVR